MKADLHHAVLGLLLWVTACVLDTYGVTNGEISNSTGPDMISSTGSTDDLPTSTPGSSTDSLDATAANDSTGVPTLCGDGKVDPGEDCDDGNAVDQDGCQSNCSKTQAVSVHGGPYTHHTCVRFHGSQQARCWGLNEYAQLGYDFFGAPGDANSAYGDVPQEVLTEQTIDLPAEIAEFALGQDHSCARTSGGAVYCWGRGEALGLLGRGTLLPAQAPWNEGTAEEARVELGGVAIALHAGRYNTCAILEDSSARCWGLNGDGEVGNGTKEPVGDDELPVALDVGADIKVAKIASGGYHNCILTSAGAVKCWGYGKEGQLGNGGTAPLLTPPIETVPLNVKAIDIASGMEHTCVIHQFGGVRCWGKNDAGQLGRGHAFDQGGTIETVPDSMDMDVQLGDGRLATQIECGYNHTCALLKNGDVMCWGSNYYGQLGYGPLANVGKTSDHSPATAGPVSLGGSALKIAVGAFHSCALMKDNVLRCWGRSNVGQLGLGTINRIGDEAGEMPPPAVPYF